MGRAVLDLDAQDFGNFLVHPLMSKANLPSGEFEFRSDGAALDIDIGRATFTGVWHGQPVVMETCQPDRWAFRTGIYTGANAYSGVYMGVVQQ